MIRWISHLTDLLSSGQARDRFDSSMLAKLPLDQIDRVTFFKRDEVATDLICCEIEIDGRHWLVHEEAESWEAVVRHVEQLPGFDLAWYSRVSQPPFAPSTTVAYARVR